jgi:hypothetical protein
MSEAKHGSGGYVTDWLTVIALAMLAYTVAVLLHEHAGHAVACVALGGRPAELGAFYVDCRYGSMPDLGIRLVALAGPIVSLITGAIALRVVGRIRPDAFHLRYWAWLFGTISLMTASGYLLFSGVSGLGDLGTSRDGALYLARPEWLWRVLATVLGGAAYALVIRLSLRSMDSFIGGAGAARVAHAQKLALTSYLTGALMSVLIGLLNPHGIVIVLMSAAASTLGGTSGLAWMMQLLNRTAASPAPPLRLRRSWAWVTAGVVVALLYTAVFRPTVRP